MVPDSVSQLILVFLLKQHYVDRVESKGQLEKQ